MVAEHLIATTRGLDRDLLSPDRASWLWNRLQRAVPDALSCVLMPDHLHMVAPPGRLRAFRGTLSRFTVVFGVRIDVREAERATTRRTAGRMIRYGLFNPIRAGLVDDPYAWTWSTLQDLSDAAFPQWTSMQRISACLRLSVRQTRRALTTTADCTPPPPRRVLPLSFGVQAALSAAAAALRVPIPDVLSLRVGRRVSVQLLYMVGTPRVTDVAQALELGESTVRRLRHAPVDAATQAALACLAEPRFTPPDENRAPGAQKTRLLRRRRGL